MPHCQKEKHNHAARSKKERRRQREEQAARKKTLAEEKAAAEAEAALKLSNNIAPVEGHGQYEIGCEPEPEYTRFNAKKRSKKHLRQDARKAMLREKLEEEERQRKQQEEEYRQRLRALREANGETEVTSEEEEEEEEEPPVLEYFVFVCECCDKRYATKNQFLNHINSKKHKRKVRIWEELGLLVTHVELRGENGNEKELYDDYEDDNDDDDDDDDDCWFDLRRLEVAFTLADAAVASAVPLLLEGIVLVEESQQDIGVVIDRKFLPSGEKGRGGGRNRLGLGIPPPPATTASVVVVDSVVIHSPHGIVPVEKNGGAVRRVGFLVSTPARSLVGLDAPRFVTLVSLAVSVITVVVVASSSLAFSVTVAASLALGDLRTGSLALALSLANLRR